MSQLSTSGEPVTTNEVILASTHPSAQRTSHLGMMAMLVVSVMLLAGILGSGLALRMWIFNWSTPVHFRADMVNAWRWGSFTVLNDKHQMNPKPNQPGAQGVTPEVFIHRLADVYQRAARFPHTLDYPAFRLSVISIWVWIERNLYPKSTVWMPQYMTGLLWFNTAIELFGFIGFFLLIRHWIIRRDVRPQPQNKFAVWRFFPWHGHNNNESTPSVPRSDIALRTRSWKPWLMGLLAASLFWFNPNVIQSAHTWIQSDVWVVPFYIAAIYLASLDLFFLAGVIIAVGSLLKGQELFGAAMFIFWPLFEGRVLRAWEYVVGLTLGFGLCISLWWFANSLDWCYLGGILLAALLAVVGIFLRDRIRWYYTMLLAFPAIPLTLWPWWSSWAHARVWTALILATWLIFGPWLFKRRRAWFYLVTGLAMAMGVIASSLPVHWMWLRTGFLYGTSVRHMSSLALPNADGLGLILKDSYHWNLTEKIFTIHWPVVYSVDMRHLLFTLFMMTTLICAGAAARHFRRNDPRFLLAMVTPWITLFAFGPCMYERYLLWGSAMLMGVAVTFDLGFVLLGILLSIISFTMTFVEQLEVNRGFRPHWMTLIHAAEPGLGYAVMLAAIICVYASLRSSRCVSQREQNCEQTQAMLPQLSHIKKTM